MDSKYKWSSQDFIFHSKTLVKGMVVKTGTLVKGMVVKTGTLVKGMVVKTGTCSKSEVFTMFVCIQEHTEVEWSRTLDVRLSEWCCSVSMVWVQIPSREEQKKLTALKSNSNTVWFNFQTYIYIYIYIYTYKVSLNVLVD